MIKSRRMRWAGHVARMGENRNALSTLKLEWIKLSSAAATKGNITVL
jgi:hypothetical protein